MGGSALEEPAEAAAAGGGSALLKRNEESANARNNVFSVLVLDAGGHVVAVARLLHYAGEGSGGVGAASGRVASQSRV